MNYNENDYDRVAALIDEAMQDILRGYHTSSRLSNNPLFDESDSTTITKNALLSAIRGLQRAKDAALGYAAAQRASRPIGAHQ